MAAPAPLKPAAAAPPPRKRPLFQIHLSTCIVLMFVAGALIWANVRDYSFTPASMAGEHHAPKVGHGWPVNIEDNVILNFRSQYILMNITSAGLIVLSVGIACEWLIRRQEHRARNGETPRSGDTKIAAGGSPR